MFCNQNGLPEIRGCFLEQEVMVSDKIRTKEMYIKLSVASEKGVVITFLKGVVDRK